MSHERPKGYIAALAVAAVVILVAGYSLRPRSAPVATITEAERVQLQNMAQRQTLQRRSQMLAGYASDLLPRALQALADPSSVRQEDPRPGELLIIVAPTNSGGPRWVTSEVAGDEEATCAGVAVHTLGTNMVIPNSLAAGVVFTMDEDFVGLVADCDNLLVIVPPDSFEALQKASSEQQTMACCGVRFAAGAEDQAGRLVAELRVGSVLDRAGVEPGDRLTGVNGNAISSDDSLRLLLQAPLLKIEVVRAGRLITLQYEAVSSGSGAAFERSPSGARVLSVTAETVAEQSGLKPGDVVVRVGGVNRPLPAAVDKALTTPGGTQLVVLRGDRRMLLGAAQ